LRLRRLICNASCVLAHSPLVNELRDKFGKERYILRVCSDVLSILNELFDLICLIGVKSKRLIHDLLESIVEVFP